MTSDVLLEVYVNDKNATKMVLHKTWNIFVTGN